MLLVDKRWGEICLLSNLAVEGQHCKCKIVVGIDDLLVGFTRNKQFVYDNVQLAGRK